MIARLKRLETAAANGQFVSRTTSAGSLMIVERASNAPQEQRDLIDRRLRNRIIAGNAIAWIAIIVALICAFSL